MTLSINRHHTITNCDRYCRRIKVHVKRHENKTRMQNTMRYYKKSLRLNKREGREPPKLYMFR